MIDVKAPARIRVTGHAASIARIQVPYTGDLDLTLVAEFFASKGVPHALAAVIAGSPKRGEMTNPAHRVQWCLDDDWNGVYLFIDVTLKGDAQGHYYLGDGCG